MRLSFYRVILFVNNVDLLADFYTRHFGFTILEQAGGDWVTLQAGAAQIALHRAGAGYSGPIGAASNTKLVFRVAEDMHVLRRQLEASGAQMQEPRAFSGSDTLYCDGADPEGNIFQLEGRQGD